MTARDNLIAALRRTDPQWTPFEIGGFNREGFELFRERTGSTDPERYFDAPSPAKHVFPGGSRLDIRDRFLPFHDLPPENYRDELPPHPSEGLFTINEWGTAFVVGSHPAYDYFVPPARIVGARSAAEVDSLPVPDFEAPYRYDHLDEQTRDLQDGGFAAIGSMTCTIFERAWQIRGLDQLLMDFLENEEVADLLLDRETRHAKARAQRFAAAGADILYLGDDVGMQDRLIMSVQVWDRFLRDRMAQIIDAAREAKPDILVMYHSDGYIDPLVPRLIDIGVDVLDPVQPECMDPAAIKHTYGDRLSFHGTLGIQHTLPFGTPEEVRRETRERIETVGKGGGLFLAPTHSIAPEVPYENIHAFVAAAREFGGQR